MKLNMSHVFLLVAFAAIFFAGFRIGEDYGEFYAERSDYVKTIDETGKLFSEAADHYLSLKKEITQDMVYLGMYVQRLEQYESLSNPDLIIGPDGLIHRPGRSAEEKLERAEEAYAASEQAHKEYVEFLYEMGVIPEPPVEAPPVELPEPPSPPGPPLPPEAGNQRRTRKVEVYYGKERQHIFKRAIDQCGSLDDLNTVYEVLNKTRPAK